MCLHLASVICLAILAPDWPIPLKLMNWYYEKDGVSQGPHPESEIVALVQRRQVVATTLVWHPGQEEWSAVESVKPEWLKQPAISATVAPPARQTVPKTEGPLPGADAAAASHLSKPKAGLEGDAVEPPGKTSFLGRLFGFGKKKK